jgi:hypothetical protein
VFLLLVPARVTVVYLSQVMYFTHCQAGLLAAAHMPTICISVLRALDTVAATLEGHARDGRTPRSWRPKASALGTAELSCLHMSSATPAPLGQPKHTWHAPVAVANSVIACWSGGSNGLGYSLNNSVQVFCRLMPHPCTHDNGFTGGGQLPLH